MRRAQPLLFLLVLLLSGCMGGGDGGPAQDPDASATSTTTPSPTAGNASAMDPGANLTAPAPTLRLVDCTNFGGVFPVPMEAARAALPAGFEPVATPSDPAGGATLYVLHLLCDQSAVDGNETGPVQVAYAELAVTPPADLGLAGITDYTVPLAIGASVDAVAARLADYKLGVTGKSTVTDVVNSGVGGRTLRMAFAGVTLEVDTVHAPHDGALGSGGFALLGVQDGVARTVVQASAQGGEAADAASVLQSDGLPLLEQARPAVRGFSVAGFTLSFTLAKTVA